MFINKKMRNFITTLNQSPKVMGDAIGFSPKKILF